MGQDQVCNPFSPFIVDKSWVDWEGMKNYGKKEGKCPVPVSCKNNDRPLANKLVVFTRKMVHI